MFVTTNHCPSRGSKQKFCDFSVQKKPCGSNIIFFEKIEKPGLFEARQGLFCGTVLHDRRLSLERLRVVLTWFEQSYGAFNKKNHLALFTNVARPPSRSKFT